MATGDVPITPGIGANVATYEVTEDAKQKDIQRIALSDSAGADALGVVGAAAWASGNGTLISLLKAIAAAVDATTPSPVKLAQDEYETVAVSQTAQTLGATGATGDYIAGILVIPATTSPGNVLLLDNATSITVFVGGASSVSNLVPFFIPLGIKSVSGAWKLTTGASVSCIGIGDFS